MHHVEIDHARIDAVFARYAAEPEQEFIGRTDAPQAEPTGDGWRAECEMISSLLFAHVCPGWDVPPDKRAEFQQRLSVVLDRWFPGGIGLSDNWGPFPQFLFAAGSIVLSCGFDWEKLKLRPIKIINEAPPADEVAPAAGSAGQKFTTVADNE